MASMTGVALCQAVLHIGEEHIYVPILRQAGVAACPLDVIDLVLPGIILKIVYRFGQNPDRWGGETLWRGIYRSAGPGLAEGRGENRTVFR